MYFVPTVKPSASGQRQVVGSLRLRPVQSSSENGHTMSASSLGTRHLLIPAGTLIGLSRIWHRMYSFAKIAPYKSPWVREVIPVIRAATESKRHIRGGSGAISVAI